MLNSVLDKEEYEKMVNMTPEILCISYLDGKYKYVNPAFYKVFGYNVDEVSNLTGFSFVHPDDIDDLNNSISSAINEKLDTINLEYRYKCKDGTYKFISWSVKILLHEELLYSIGRDITERKILEYELVKAKSIAEFQAKQFTTLLSNITEGVIVADAMGNMLSMNPVALRIYGFSSLEEVKCVKDLSTYFEAVSLDGGLIPPEKLAMGRALRGEVFTNYEIPMSHKNIDLKWIGSYGGTPIYDENGEMVMAIITLRDITERKKVEEELKYQKELLETIIESMSDGILIGEKNANFNLVNSAAKNFFYDSDSISQDQDTVKYNKYYYDIDGEEVPLEDVPSFRISNKGKYNDYRLTIIRPDKKMYVSVNGSPIYNRDGKIKSLVLCIRDITESVLQDKAINRLQKSALLAEKERNEALEIALEMQEEFFANVSHELKTPLNVIFATSQILNMYCNNGQLDKKKDSIIKHIYSIKQNAYRLSKLINNLVDLSKIEAGFFELNLSNNNIVEVVEEIVMSVTDFTEVKGLNIIFDTDTEEKIIACDPEKIERIVLNLISNAIKFSSEGDEILVNIKDNGESVGISVSDNGIGIEVNHLDMIFDRFKQVDKSLSRNAEGTGIGLSLVKSIVELHDGSISVESEFGKGSKFTVVLPTRKVMRENTLPINKIRDKAESIYVELSDIYS